MAKVILWMQMSVDGFIEGPNGEFDWPVVRPELHRAFNERAKELGGLLYGRKVFEGMAAFWPTADEDPDVDENTAAFARLWRPIPKTVFSRTLVDPGWNATVVGDDVAGAVARLKAGAGGDLALLGGADIAATFIREGLVDEYLLFHHPVILGGGKRLFPSPADRVRLRLLEARTFDGGVVVHHYEPVS
jgi:dihydrofolate reductase